MATKSTLPDSTRPTATSEVEVEVEVYDDDDNVEEKLVIEEVTKMADVIKEYRSTLPRHLNSTLSSLFLSRRPSLSVSSHLDLFLGEEETCSEESEHANRGIDDGDGEQTVDDIQLLNEKISSNISSMPKVLKRMNECLSRVDRLVFYSNRTIHPSFKRRKS